ncbi:MAG: alpha/beta hydrolase fold domain-containing protein [Pseudomonadota bacterium]
MSTRPLVEPALLPLIEAFPTLELSDASLPAVRDAFLALEPAPEPLPAGVEVKEIAIPGLDGQPEGRALHYAPPGPPRGTIVHFHGGGLVLGRPEQMRATHARIAAEMGLDVIAPAYRLAPEHPAPAAVRDGLAAVLWAQRLNPKLIIGGDSAGGGLAASVAAAARGRLARTPALLALLYPMLDPRTGGEDDRSGALTGEFVWTRQANQYGWRSYLAGTELADAHVVPFLDTLDGLPPTFIATGTLDLFYAENLRFAAHLTESGVYAELVAYPGAVHGFPAVADACAAQRYAQDYTAAIDRALR